MKLLAYTYSNPERLIVLIHWGWVLGRKRGKGDPEISRDLVAQTP